MSLLTIISGLIGCGNTERKGKKHSISDIRVFSMSCCHMDRNYGYLFTVKQNDAKWLFNAECSVENFTEPVELKDIEIGTDDMDALFAVLEKYDTVAYAESYKKRHKPLFDVHDQTVYGFTILFSDESTCDAELESEPRRELENIFYRLAEESIDRGE